jgi:1,4-dihydroxy-2-naphthoate octaprenyltransferase
MLGFGLLTPLAGWGLTGQPLTPWFWKICIGFGFLFGALYPATQIYQIEEDAARGDRTLVIKLGVANSLIAAILLQLAAHLMFVWASFERGVTVFPPWLFVSFAAWDLVILQWITRWPSLTQRQHESRMYWLLACWAVTDIVLLWMLWPR